MSAKRIAELEAELADRGCATIDLPDPGPVHRLADWLVARLRAAFPALTTLDDYHEVARDDDRHIAVLHETSAAYWQAELGRAIIAANLDVFRSLVGPDLHIQRYPYLRVVRPGEPRDAVPLHRDTYYGASPYELSVVVPLTDMSGEAAVRAIPGSHLEPDAAYPFVQLPSTDVAKGSPRHELGYAYAPRALDPGLAARAVPMPARVGQAVIFGLSLVHGGGANASRRTRFSTDIRVVNAFAPVQMSRGVHPDYFVPLCSSALTRSAARYRAANARDGA